MESLSLTASDTAHKYNVSNLTRDASEVMNLSSGREIKSKVLAPYKVNLQYAKIPMQKPLPQWRSSSSTLRHSASFHRFSKGQKLPGPKLNYQDAQQFEIPSTLGKRSCSFGIGRKVSVPEVFSHGISSATKLTPFYNLDTDMHRRSNSAISLRQGKSFGLGWKEYERSRTPHRNSVHSSYQVRANPGPNYYSLNPQGKNTSRKAKMHERLPMFSTHNGNYRLVEPHPQSYQPKQELIKQNKRQAGFGYGNKTDFTKMREKSPGPIYNLSGFADKFGHLKVKLHQA